MDKNERFDKVSLITDRMMHNLFSKDFTGQQKHEIVFGLVNLLGEMELIALAFAVDMTPIQEKKVEEK